MQAPDVTLGSGQLLLCPMPFAVVVVAVLLWQSVTSSGSVLWQSVLRFCPALLAVLCASIAGKLPQDTPFPGVSMRSQSRSSSLELGVTSLVAVLPVARFVLAAD